MNIFTKTIGAGALALGLAATSMAQTWTRVPGAPDGSSLSMLLTDGSVIVHVYDAREWWKLTPNKKGSYVNGTWKQIASLPAGYGPLYFASAVLKDGRVFIQGGEYNLGPSAWTNKGAWYDPILDKWTNLNPPSGWNSIGDVQCTVMPDGHVLMASLDTRIASLDPSTMTWTQINSTGKQGVLNEEGWTLMPDGTILTTNAVAAPGSERYIPTLGKWISAGTVPVTLNDDGSEELGPVSLMPDGKAIAIGAIGHNAIYTPGANLLDTGSWAALPDLPSAGGGQLAEADGPSVVLPNGHLLIAASPGVFATGTFFYEWDGSAFNAVPSTPNAPGISCFQGNFLLLPSGQVLFTDFSNDVEIYTPTGSPNAAWKPTITSAPGAFIVGKTLTLKGTQFNGLTQGSFYGDDNSNFTNYPLAQITYTSSGNVAYFRTHDHSTMAVATGSKIVSTMVDVPATAELGKAKLRIVTNGIASDPIDITVTKDALKPDGVGMYEGTGSTGNLTSIQSSDNSYFTVNSITQRGYGEVASAFATFTTTGSVSNISCDFETSVSQSVQMIYFIYNWNTGLYDTVGNAAQSTTDKVGSFNIANNGAYVSGTGKVKVLFRAVSPTRSGRSAAPITLRVDQVSLNAG